MNRLLKKPSPSMVVAMVALFLATTGTGVAVVSALPKGSVGSKQLKAGAVNSSKVKNRSLKAIDFARGQLPRGARGPAGPAGEGGATSIVKRTAKGTFGTTFSTVTARCNPGEVATGGGADWDTTTSDGWPVVAYSVPDPYGANTTPTGWAVEVDNVSGGGGVQAIAWVLCSSP